LSHIDEIKSESNSLTQIEYGILLYNLLNVSLCPSKWERARTELCVQSIQSYCSNKTWRYTNKCFVYSTCTL